jgi:glycine/D-amino acid oxidase-like deaminating enzyme
MAEFPERANVVIIGLGGIVGASVAHHLIERGWDDIVGIDKSGIPTTAHASDFCYATSHDFLSCWTTRYSIDFFERMGHYAKVGGLEIARVGDDARMDEIKRKVASGKAFGTGVRLVSPAEIKEKFPLVDLGRQCGEDRQAEGLRQHARHRPDYRGGTDKGCRNPARQDTGRQGHRLCRALGTSHRRHGR